MSEYAETQGVDTDHSAGQLVLSLGSVTRQDTDRVGGKAGPLGELLKAGYNVPDGFVVTTTAFRQAIGGLQDGDDLLPESVSDAIRSQLRSFRGELAVRSSGVSEDAEGSSFAGQYTTFLGVEGEEAVLKAVADCMASAFSDRVGAYRVDPGDMAVLIQQQIHPDAAGVAFTVDPVTGSRDKVVIDSVSGLAEGLVSGEVDPDEWLVGIDGAECRANRFSSITSDLAVRIADIARRIEVLLGGPQDIEWAVKNGEVYVLQARPITALPDQVDWQSSLPGGWLRNLRLGEWIGEPLTPLFDSWLLPRIERGFSDQYHEWFGFRSPPPLHQTVSGWYFGTMGLPHSVLGMAAMFGRLIVKGLRHPRRVTAALPPLAGIGMELYVKDWRDDLLPRYRAAVRDAEAEVVGAGPQSLISTVNHLGDMAGRYFASLTVVGGYGWKTELPLARFYSRHIMPSLGGSHQTLLSGLSTPKDAPPHAVQGLDWHRPTLGEISLQKPQSIEAVGHEPGRRRIEAEHSASGLLKHSPKLAREFQELLVRAQQASVLRDEHVSSFTLPWPVLRVAAIGIGQALTESGVLDRPDDIFFLRFDEVEDAISGNTHGSHAGLVQLRRAEWKNQTKLVPPESIGPIPRVLKGMLKQAEIARSGKIPEGAVTGLPASPGQVAGVARIILTLEDSDRLQVGEVLVAPITSPAWTPLFRKAAAVVTDIGSVISHASLVAREYGIPAVVGTGNGTSRIRDGAVVTVDGSVGSVRVAGDMS